jgi:hypothetical protein
MTTPTSLMGNVGTFATLCSGFPTEINDIKDLDGFSLFPNPATSELRIQNSKLRIEKAEIYDLMGEKVFSENQESRDKNQVVVDVSSLPAGIYFISVRDERGYEAMKKFVKM